MAGKLSKKVEEAKAEPEEEKKVRGRPKGEKASPRQSKAKAKVDDKAKGKAKKSKDKGKDAKEEKDSKKKKKDPAAPKKALSNYMIFGNEVRPKMMKDHPDWKVGDFGKEIGKQWALVTDKQKEKYAKLVEKEKER